jgi:UDP-N-acetylmuramate: L-alanyl-gamma-D-glutamyl-meso-diaminopimelate ligase
VHYHPRTLILNNLEFDHADIFPDLAAIERQFHHLVRTVPATGQIIRPGAVAALTRVEEMGCWTPVKTFAENEGDWRWHCISDDASEFDVLFEGKSYRVDWALTGQHNLTNAVASIAAARHMGVTPEIAAQALCEFRSVKRRMELVNPERPIAVYDDFAHHPTAIQTTLQGAKASLSKSGKGRLLAVLEPRSNTMKLGHHRHELAASVNDADVSFWFQPENIEWSLEEVTAHCQQAASVYDDTERLIEAVVAEAQPGDRIVVMSNGGFQNVPRRIATALAKIEETSHA